MKKFGTTALIVLGLMLLGAAVTYSIMKREKVDLQETDAVIILDKIEKVCKLVTVEGNYSENYDEKNIRELTVYLPFPSTFKFSKSAAVQVNGKVLVGYDMKDIEVEIDSINGIVRLKNMPDPQIISVDHEITYKDFDDSWFNTWKAEDYTQLSKNAKDVIRDRATEERLMQEAEEQGNQMIEVIRFLVESAGMRLEVEEREKAGLLD